MLKANLRRLLTGIVHARARDLSKADLRAPALVFAPHPDDETLGCGGLIARKRELGVPVKVVLMTDGSRGPNRTGAAGDLAALRARELRAALRALGLAPDDLIGLGFADGGLTGAHDAAVARVRALLRKHAPAQVIVPYRHDGHDDHAATYRIVTAALRAHRSPVTVLEYPVWFWYHWPWVNVPLPRRRDLLGAGKRSLLSSWRLREFAYRLPLGAALAKKRAAFDRHASQQSLGDFSHGEFLACFFTGLELYRRSAPPRADTPAADRAHAPGEPAGDTLLTNR